MTSTTKVLIPHQDVPNATATAYASPTAGKGTWIDKFTATNHTAGALTMSVHLVPSGGSALPENIVVSDKALAANETYIFPELVGKFLAPGDFIAWVASAAASISSGSNGRELT